MDDEKTLKVRENLQDYLIGLRNMAEHENDTKSCNLGEVIFVEPRKGFYNGEYVDRLVVFLRGTGCMLAKETGGCTFCGFYNATNYGKKVLDEDYINQIKSVINDQSIQFQKYPTICLYNDGSLLREDEISLNALLEIFKRLDNIDTVKKIVIEARICDITEEKLKSIRKVTKKEFEIAVGFESANPTIRDLCINKRYSNESFEEVLRIAKTYSVSIIPLLIVKPPFLTETEAIDDYINSLKYLEQFNVKRIDMELASVEKHTLVYDMWVNHMYQTPKLWSVIEILKRREQLGMKTPIYVSPDNYSVTALAHTSNCDDCNHKIVQLFEEFNRYGKASIFDDVHCHCKEEWLELLKEKETKSLVERVGYVLEKLNKIDIEKEGKNNENGFALNGTLAN